MNPYASNLIEAAHGVRTALDSLEATENVADLADAINRACNRLSDLTDAIGSINHYLEQMVVLAKKELGDM